MLLHERLRQYRGEVGLTQEEVAVSLGVSYSTYKNYERGTYSPAMELTLPLCKLFSITPLQLLGWNQDTQTTKVKI